MEKGNLKGTFIKKENGKVIEVPQKYYFNDFLINNGERGISKYGFILERIISKK